MEKKFFKNFSIILFLICSCLIISSSVAMDTSRSYDSSASSIDSPEGAASVANSPDHSGPHSPSGSGESSRSSSPGSKAANASGLDERALLVKTLKESLRDFDLGDQRDSILQGLEKPENLLVLALLQSRIMKLSNQEEKQKQISNLIEKIKKLSADQNLQERRRFSGEFKLNMERGIECTAGEFFVQQARKSQGPSGFALEPLFNELKMRLEALPDNQELLQMLEESNSSVLDFEVFKSHLQKASLEDSNRKAVSDIIKELEAIKVQKRRSLRASEGSSENLAVRKCRDESPADTLKQKRRDSIQLQAKSITQGAGSQ